MGHTFVYQDGHTALMRAVHHGHVGIVEQLLDRRARIDLFHKVDQECVVEKMFERQVRVGGIRNGGRDDETGDAHGLSRFIAHYTGDDAHCTLQVAHSICELNV